MNARQRMARLASFVRNKAAPLAATVAATLGVATSAHAVDPTDALAALGGLSTSSAGFGPVMFGFAVTAVGIMIGVKWIKRAKGAA